MSSTNINDYTQVYFIGIGGIGMSALARYFRSKGVKVYGYDKTKSPLTQTLEKEGIEIHYDDRGTNFPNELYDRTQTLIIYTPAIPKDMGELVYFQQNNYDLLKRAEVLGLITRNSKALGVAGTHGKTTTSTLLAYLLDESHLKCNAFLGGVAANFNSNFVSHPTSAYTVVEADEFDRSFLQLQPYASIITSTDADHLDIYGDDMSLVESFQAYTDLTHPDGVVIAHKNAKVDAQKIIRYGLDDPDCAYSGTNLRYANGQFCFDLSTPIGFWENIELGVPGIHNAENAIACIAMCVFLGIPKETIYKGIKHFKGVKRRFEYHLREADHIYIDDYAHHPTEIDALISSVKLLYPEQPIIGIFQPHLFSRTRDFFEGFVTQLSRLDEVILLPIYPAREIPIEGVTSEALLERITCPKKHLMEPAEVISYAKKITHGVVLTIGAGDIDRIVEPLKAQFSE